MERNNVDNICEYKRFEWVNDEGREYFATVDFCLEGNDIRGWKMELID